MKLGAAQTLLPDSRATFSWDVPVNRLLEGRLITNDGPWVVESIDWKIVVPTSNVRHVYRVQVVVRNVSEDPATCVLIFCTERETL